jgi:hypothetical protein
MIKENDNLTTKLQIIKAANDFAGPMTLSIKTFNIRTFGIKALNMRHST